MNFITEQQDFLELKVRIHPNAKKSSFAGIWNETHLKININAPAVDGKANEALYTYLAKALHMRKSAIQLLNGETSREKKIALFDISKEEFLNKINLS